MTGPPRRRVPDERDLLNDTGARHWEAVARSANNCSGCTARDSEGGVRVPELSSLCPSAVKNGLRRPPSADLRLDSIPGWITRHPRVFLDGACRGPATWILGHAAQEGPYGSSPFHGLGLSRSGKQDRGAALAAKPPEEWDGLTRVKSKRMNVVFLAPGADFRPYHRVMLDPTEIAFRKNWMRDYNNTRVGLSGRVSDSDVQRVITEGGKASTEIFAKAFTDGGYPVVTEPAPDVLRVRTGSSVRGCRRRTSRWPVVRAPMRTKLATRPW